MQRSVLAATATLVVLLSCSDSPTIPIAAVHEGRTSDLLVSPDGLNTIGDVLGDPLVQALVESVRDRGVAQRLRAALEDLGLGASLDHAGLVRYALAEARRDISGSADASDAVVLAMLSVVLDQVQSVLASVDDTEPSDDRQPMGDEPTGQAPTERRIER